MKLAPFAAAPGRVVSQTVARLFAGWVLACGGMLAGPVIELDSSNSVVLNVSNNDNLTLAGPGTFTNDGSVNLLSSGNSTDLVISGGTVTIAGSGLLSLSDNFNNRIYGSGGTVTFVNASGHTIQGAGQLGVNLLSITNQGFIVANASTALLIDPDAGGLTNTGTLRATGNATLRLTNGTYANVGGTIEAQAGSQVRFESAAVSGGTLTSTGTGRLANFGGSSFADILLSGGSNLDINNNTAATFSGTITNQGTINLLSIGNSTDFVAAADGVILSGGGILSLSNNVNNRIYSAGGAAKLTNVNNTIRGAGQIGVNLLQLDNKGIIEANLSGSALILDPNANGATNTGSLIAVNGGVLRLLNGTFDNTGGLIQAQSSSTVELSGATVIGGTLDTPSDGVIRIVSAATFGGALTTNPSTQIEIANNTSLTLLASGTYTHNGTLKLASIGNSTDLVLSGGDVTLSGSGFVNLGNNANNRVYGSGADRLILTSNLTLQGSGQVGVNLMGLVNQGLVLANQSTPLIVDPSGAGVANSGFLRAQDGATLRLTNGDFTNTGAGRIEALGTGSVVEFSGANVVGGQLASDTGAALRNTSGSTYTDVTLTSGSNFEILNNTAATFAGTLTNSGSLALLSVGNSTDFLVGGGNLTLTGGGTVTLGDNANNRIYGADGTYRLVNVNNTIQGRGQIGVNLMGLDNQATIDANVTGGSLVIDPSASGATNSGLLTANNGGVLVLRGGVFDNTGGTIAPGVGSRVDLESATVQGGLLGGSTIRNVIGSTLADVTVGIGTIVEIANNTALTLEGVIGNDGVFRLLSGGNSTDVIVGSGGVTLSGGGVFELSNNGNNRIYGASGAAVLNNLGNTIRGGGQLGVNQLTLINTGTIEANQPTPLTINLTNSAPFTNQGLLRAASGSTLVLVDSFTNASQVSIQSGGTLTAQGAYTQSAGDTSLQGGTLAAASITVQGGMLQGAGTVTGSMTNSGTIAPGAGGVGDGIGALFFNQSLILTPTSLLQIQIGGPTTYDKIQAQTASLGGTLAVSFVNGFEASILSTDTFTLLSTDALGRTGTFFGLPDGALLTTADGFGTFQIAYLDNGVTIANFAPVPEPSTYALLGAGAVALLLFSRRRRIS